MFKRNSRRNLEHGTFVFAAFCVQQASLHAQTDRITRQIDNQERVVLSGNVHPRALPPFDQGPVDPSMKVAYVTLMLKPSASQQATLKQLLAEQQDRTSPNYHRWLTPEGYADRFGLTPGDIGKLRSWLESEGFAVNYVARGRNWLAFSGTAKQVEKAFHTAIHRYAVDGETQFANATEPTIPAALEPVVVGVIGLDNFRSKAPRRGKSMPDSKRMSSRLDYTFPNGTHILAPDDLATIYDIMPLYKNGVDGSGQRIAVAGQSDISLADIAGFRQALGLPANAPLVLLVPGSPDPGFTTDAEEEADLDIEWAGAVARNASIIYVYSTDALNSAQYAIDQNLAPVITFSFGSCEVVAQTQVSLSAAQSVVRQGNSQGITGLAASGDSGAAGCDPAFSSSVATLGAAVSFPASIPEVTAVGGTQFDEGAGTYWSPTNSPTGASALSYIPETAWNESGFEGVLAASGGGFSIFYQQPPWQTGPGVPNVNARAVPDISMSAANDHDSYAIVTGGAHTSVGGTSAASPVFAGIIALLNQYERSNGQGNINPNLYRLAQSTTNVFHDITTGNNIVPCQIGTPNCTTGAFGYYAGPGYDLVTGLGSVNAYNLVTEWNAATPQSNVIPSCTPDPVYEQQPNAQGYSWFYTISLTETAGVATTFTGFTLNGFDYSSKIVSFFGASNIPAHGTISAALELKDVSVPTIEVFGFTGVDASGRQWSQQLSVPFFGPQSSPTPPTISSVVNAASYQVGMSPGALGTLFGNNLSPVTGIEFPGGVTSYRGVSVTVEGNAAPLFVITNVNGQEQINFQVPVGIISNGSVQVQVSNNGSIGTLNGVSVNLVQPGIFEYVPAGTSENYAAVLKPDGSTVGPTNPASLNSTESMFLTGLGPTSPALSTGQPGPTPPATTNYQPTVRLNNNFSAPVTFSGVAPGFIGLDQVNFFIPANAPTGSSLSLTVSVNGVASQTSRIAVQ